MHDHEITFYRYGSAHQECLAHVERYLKDSMENESSLTWNRRMRELLQRMIHYRKEHTGETSLDPQTVAGFEAEYQEILDKAKEEYKRNEPSPYYHEGYNLYRRMQEYKTEHHLFLHDMRVPTTNIPLSWKSLTEDMEPDLRIRLLYFNCSSGCAQAYPCIVAFQFAIFCVIIFHITKSGGYYGNSARSCHQ